jgi:hypothetical protein
MRIHLSLKRLKAQGILFLGGTLIQLPDIQKYHSYDQKQNGDRDCNPE